MGILRGSSKGGWQCEDNADGSKHCVRFEKDKEGNKVATGTDISIATDQDCKPVIGGDV